MKMIKGAPATSVDDYQLNTTTMIRHSVRNFPDQEILYRKNGEIERYILSRCFYTYEKDCQFSQKPFRCSTR